MVSIVTWIVSVKQYFIAIMFQSRLTRSKYCSEVTIPPFVLERSVHSSEGIGQRFTNAILGAPPGGKATCVAIAPRIHPYLGMLSDKETARSGPKSFDSHNFAVP